MAAPPQPPEPAGPTSFYPPLGVNHHGRKYAN
jgi:hypothetical protein